jgi:hypothetical protein
MTNKVFDLICTRLQTHIAFTPDFSEKSIIAMIDSDNIDVFATAPLFQNFATPANAVDLALGYALPALNDASYMYAIPSYANLHDSLAQHTFLSAAADTIGSIRDITIESLSSMVDAIEYLSIAQIAEEFHV